MRVADLRKYADKLVELRWEDAELESGVDDVSALELPVWKSVGWLVLVGRVVGLAQSMPEKGEPRGLDVLKVRASWVTAVQGLSEGD